MLDSLKLPNLNFLTWKMVKTRDFEPLSLLSGGCANVTCPSPYSACVGPGGRCECPASCDGMTGLVGGAVCGTDGRTYDSECALRISSCRANARVAVASVGGCGE